jgi:hypothetical protein
VIAVLGVVAYLLVGLVIARFITQRSGRVSKPDAFYVVLFWPLVLLAKLVMVIVNAVGGLGGGL